MQGQLVRVAIYVWMDWNEGMKEGKHQLRQVSYPMGLASDHKRRDWTQVGKAGSQPISPIKQASESTGFLSSYPRDRRIIATLVQKSLECQVHCIPINER